MAYDTFGRLKKDIAQASGDLVEWGTTSSGTVTTAVDTTRFTDANADRLLGKWIYFFDGAAQGSEARISAFTGNTATLDASIGVSPGANSLYMVTERFSGTDYTRVIRNFLRRYYSYFQQYIDRSLVAQSLLRNGTSWNWSTTLPTNWTATGTGTYTQETTVTKHGTYAVKILSTGTNAAGLKQSLSYIGRYRGQTLSYKEWVFTDTTGSRVNIQITDGKTTTTTSVTTANRGWGTDELEATLLIADNASEITVSRNITADAAGSVTAYFSGGRLTGPGGTNEYYTPGTPTALWAVRYDDGPLGQNQFTGEIRPDVESYTEDGSLDKLRFLRRLPEGAIIEMRGYQAHANIAFGSTADDDVSFTGNPDWLVAECAMELLRGRQRNEQDQQRLAALERHALDQRKQYRQPFPPNTVVLNPAVRM